MHNKQEATIILLLLLTARPEPLICHFFLLVMLFGNAQNYVEVLI